MPSPAHCKSFAMCVRLRILHAGTIRPGQLSDLLGEGVPSPYRVIFTKNFIHSSCG